MPVSTFVSTDSTIDILLHYKVSEASTTCVCPLGTVGCNTTDTYLKDSGHKTKYPTKL